MFKHTEEKPMSNESIREHFTAGPPQPASPGRVRTEPIPTGDTGQELFDDKLKKQPVKTHSCHIVSSVELEVRQLQHCFLIMRHIICSKNKEIKLNNMLCECLLCHFLLLLSCEIFNCVRKKLFPVFAVSYLN